jgi:acetyltransferase
LGAGNNNIKLNATFFPHPVGLKKGRVSLVSQSGGVAGLMIYAASDAGLGVAKFASIGNRVNIDFDDMLRFLGQDPETEVVCLFVEGTERGRSMYEEMAKLTPRKPVIVYKVGKTPASMRAAKSHTGSLAGQQELYSAAVRQANGIEVESVSDMIDTARVLVASGGRRRGPNVAILTHTLGPALIAAQILEEHGIQLPMPVPETALRIEEMLSMPVHIPISNPIDLLAQGWAEPRVFAGALQLLMKDDRYDALMTVFSPNYQEEIGGGMPVEDIAKYANESDKIVVAVLNAPESRPPPGKSVLEDGGVPVFSSPERAARALANALGKKD